MNIKVGGIITYKNKILVIKRNVKDGGFWQTMTGTVENNETLEETLKREIYEETGLTGNSNYPSILYSFIWHRDNEEYLEIVFQFQSNSGNVKLSHEHTNYAWLSQNDAINRVKTENNKKAIGQINLSKNF